MPDFATLVLGADTRDLKVAVTDLDRVVDAGGRAQGTADKLKLSTDRLGASERKAAASARQLAAGVTGTTGAMGAATRSSGAMSLALGGVRRAMLGVASAVTAMVAGFSLGKFISATSEADAAQAQLAAAIKSTSGAAGQSLASLNAHAAALQRVTKFGDEATNAMQGVLLTFTSVKGVQFERATVAVQDLATAMRMDLNSAALQVGKALNDPILGLTALSRAGIQFSDAQKVLIKGMVEVGQTAQAQNIILGELERQFGGSAKAARETLGGALTALGNAWGDLFELAGPASENLRKAIERLVATISSPGFVGAIQHIGSALFTAADLGARGFKFAADNADFFVAVLGVMALRAIPSAVAGLASMATWLGTSAVAARGLAVAMNAIPLVAGVMAVTAIWRNFSDGKRLVGEYQAALEGLTGAQEGLNRASAEFYENITAASEQAYRSATKAAEAQAKLALDVARQQLANASFKTNFFGISLYETEAMKTASAEIERLRGVIFEYESTLSLLDHTVENFKWVPADATGAVDGVAASVSAATSATYAAIPAFAALQEKYGALALSARDVLAAQNALAVADAKSGIARLTAQAADLTDNLHLVGAEASLFKTILTSIGQETSLSRQSVALKGMAAQIALSAGGLSQMDEKTRQVYQAMLAASIQAAELASQTGAAASWADDLARIAAQAAVNFFGARDGGAALAAAIYAARDAADALGRTLASALSLLNSVGAGVVETALKATTIGQTLGGAFGAAKTGILAAASGALKFGKVLTGVVPVTKSIAASIGDGGGGSGGKSVVEALTDAQKAAVEFADTIKGKVGQAVDDTVGWMLDGFKGGFRGLLNIAISTIKQILAFAIANPIKMSLGLTGGGVAGAAQAAGQTGAAGGGLGFLGNIAGIGNALLGGFTNSLGALFSGGFGTMFGSIGAQIGAAATGSLTAIAGAIGAVAGPIALVVGLFSAFKTKTKLLDAGIRVTVDNMDTLVQTFQRVEKSRLFGLIKSKSTSYGAADADIADPVSAAVAQIQGSILNMAQVLGVGSTAFADFSATIAVSTRGLSDADAAKAVQDALTDLSDQFAGMVPGLENLQAGGEGATAALQRLATSFSALSDAANLLGHAALSASLRSGALASMAVEAAGGLDAFGSAVQTYFAGFYSDEEQLAARTRILTGAMGDLGLAMPRSRDQFRALIEGVDTSTESGAKLYGQLLGLAGAFDQVLPAVASFTAQILALVGTASSGIDAMIEAATTSMRAEQAAASLWYRTAQTLRAFIADLKGTAGALISPEQARAFAQAQFSMLSARAAAGDNQAASDLPNAARTLLETSRATARTRVDLARTEAQVLSALGLAAGVSDVEGARHDVVAGLLGQQVDLLTSVKEYLTGGGALDPDQIDALNASLGSLQSAIDAAKSISYAAIIQALEVNVDLIATADVPPEIRQLLLAGNAGITSTVDFIVRSDMTPDQKWIALTGSSELAKTISFLAINVPDSDVIRLAVGTVGALTRTINLITGATLDPETRRIALAGSSELSRVVNVALASGADPAAIRLALAGAATYSVAVRAALDASVSAAVRRVVVEGAGGYAAMIQGAFSPGLSETARRVLLTQQGVYSVNVLGLLSSAMPDAMRQLLLQANTSAARAVTIATVWPGSVTAAERDLLLTNGATILRTIQAGVSLTGLSGIPLQYFDELRKGAGLVLRGVQAGVSMAGVTGIPLQYFDEIRKGSGIITRIINGSVNLGALTPAQQSLLAAISGATPGNITLGGSFSFDPSTGFQTWYESTTQASIAQPLATVRLALTDLAAQLRADMADRQRAAVVAQVNAWAQANLARNDAGAFFATEKQTAALAGMLGIPTAGKTLAETNAAIAAASNADAIRGVQSWEAALFPYLQGTFAAKVVPVDAADYLRIYTDVAKDARYASDAAGHYRDYGRAEILAGKRGFNPQAFDWGAVGIHIPGFATGTGFAPGGRALVGEQGPELVDLPRGSRVYSAPQTRSMADQGALLKELAELRREVALLREEQRSGLISVARNTRRSADADEELLSYAKDTGIPVDTTP